MMFKEIENKYNIPCTFCIFEGRKNYGNAFQSCGLHREISDCEARWNDKVYKNSDYEECKVKE